MFALKLNWIYDKDGATNKFSIWRYRSDMLLYCQAVRLTLKSLVCRKAFILVFFCFLVSTKQKPCWSLKFQGCISSFWWPSPEEVQELSKAKLESFFLAIFLCAMDLKTIKGHLDLACLHIWVWLLKN